MVAFPVWTPDPSVNVIVFIDYISHLIAFKQDLGSVLDINIVSLENPRWLLLSYLRAHRSVVTPSSSDIQ